MPQDFLKTTTRDNENTIVHGLQRESERRRCPQSLVGGRVKNVLSPGLGLQQVYSPLINPQPEVTRPVAGEGLRHIKEGGAVQRPALYQVQKSLLSLFHLHSCKKCCNEHFNFFSISNRLTGHWSLGTGTAKGQISIL
jgi:hypothetical protein